MEVSSSPIEWDPQEDREIFAQFLKTKTGTRLVPKLLESVPALLAGGNVNEILIRSGEVRGWQEAVSSLLALASVIPDTPHETPSGSYIPLEDDSKWGDGQRLGQTPKTQ